MGMKYRKYISTSQINIDHDRSRVTVVDYPQLKDGYGMCLGEGMAMFRGQHKEIFILNTETGLMRQFVNSDERLLVDDSEVNDRQISNHLSNGHNYLRNRIASFGGLHTWDGFKAGFCALDWTIYPDGRYFADEDGFGMESNDEEVAYCVVNKNLDIIVPFFYAEDPKDVLDAVRAGTYKQVPIEPINRQEVIVDVFPIPTMRDKIATRFWMIYYSIKEKFTRNKRTF